MAVEAVLAGTGITNSVAMWIAFGVLTLITCVASCSKLWEFIKSKYVYVASLWLVFLVAAIIVTVSEPPTLSPTPPPSANQQDASYQQEAIEAAKGIFAQAKKLLGAPHAGLPHLP